MAAKKPTKKTTTALAPLPVTAVTSVLSKAGEAITDSLKSTAYLLGQRLSPEGYSTLAAFFTRTAKVIEAQGKATRDALKAYLTSATDESVEVKRDAETSRETSRTLRTSFEDRTVVATLSLPRASQPDGAMTEALLQGKKLPLTVGCDQVITYAPNIEKLEALVKRGTISQAEYNALFPTRTPSLKVTEEVAS